MLRYSPIVTLPSCRTVIQMGKHGGKPKGGWRQLKRKRCMSDALVGRPVEHAKKLTDFATDTELALALWSDNYDELLLSSMDSCPLLKAALEGFMQDNSSYHKRRIKPREERQRECDVFLGSVLSLCTKFVNSKAKQFVVAARSISGYRQRMRGRQWQADAKTLKQLYSKVRTKQLLQTMALCEPPPAFNLSKQMSKTCYDQCHIWDTTSTTATRKRGNERTNLEADKDGIIRKQVNQVTVINHINFGINGDKYKLSDYEVEQINLHGVYKLPYEEVLQHHFYYKVQQDLKVLWQEHRVIVSTQGGFDGVILLVNRPSYQPEAATHMTYGQCIPKCDTKTPAELVRILGVMEEWNQHAHVYINVSDGQSCINETAIKRRFPHRYRKHLAMSAGLHMNGHDSGGKNFLYWLAMTEACADHLEKRHVEQHFKNFNDDRWDHLKFFLAEVECAVQLFFDTHFSPESMQSWDVMFNSYQHNATLVVMMYFSLQVGTPHIGWMRGTRSNRVEIHDVCMGWKLHTSRAAHQTGSVKICLIRQVGRYCAWDGIRTYLEQEASVSMNGEMGGNTFEDRCVEWLNGDCKEYSNQCTGFGDIMSHGPILKPMMHVDKVYSKSVGTKVDLPVRAARSFDNNILNLLSYFESLVPDVDAESDISGFSKINIWSEIQPNLRRARPWDFIEKVSNGTTAPMGCDPKTSVPKSYPSERKRWQKQAQTIFDEQFPPNKI